MCYPSLASGREVKVAIRVPPNGVRNGRRYPWDDWFGRKDFVLVRGKDFPDDVTCNSMRQMCVNVACKLRLRVETKVYERTATVRVRVVGELPEARKKYRRRK